MKKLNISNTIVIEKDPIATDRTSDRSELIPAEVKADTINYSNKLREPGSTINDEGIVNNYAAEPDASLANNLLSKQQKPYILFGIGATLFIAIALATAFNLN
ncbi:MAG: ssl1498 family light-harvesting-like protein [Cyanobacteria bacterium P01_A01_bin.83]